MFHMNQVLVFAVSFDLIFNVVKNATDDRANFLGIIGFWNDHQGFWPDGIASGGDCDAWRRIETDKTNETTIGPKLQKKKESRVLGLALCHIQCKVLGLAFCHVVGNGGVTRTFLTDKTC